MIVHRKLNIHSLSPHLCADGGGGGGGGGCLSPQNTSGVSGVNGVAAVTIQSKSIVTSSSDVIKPQDASIRLVWCHPSVRKPRRSCSTQNKVIYTKFWALMSGGSGFASRRSHTMVGLRVCECTSKDNKGIVIFQWTIPLKRKMAAFHRLVQPGSNVCCVEQTRWDLM